MPPDRYSSQAFRIDMLDLRVLDTPDGLDTALRAIGAVCHWDDFEITKMVAVLDSRPHILEYIISSMLGVFALRPCLFPAPTLISPSSARGGGL